MNQEAMCCINLEHTKTRFMRPPGSLPKCVNGFGNFGLTHFRWDRPALRIG